MYIYIYIHTYAIISSLATYTISPQPASLLAAFVSERSESSFHEALVLLGANQVLGGPDSQEGLNYVHH